MGKILYISYDGMTDQLGQSQVIPYLIGLSKAGHDITLISFEKEPVLKKKKKVIDELLSLNNIHWRPLLYTKRPPVLSTMFDLNSMKALAVKLHKKDHFDIVHCRSYIAAITGLFMKRNFGIKFIFDMRGFWADERIDGGLWKMSNQLYRSIYRYFKYKEREFFTEADYIISLTDAGKAEIANILKPQLPRPIKVIPCCSDIELFSKKAVNSDLKDRFIKEMGIQKEDFILSYLGAIGTWYMLDEMLQFFASMLLKMPHAKFLFITNESPSSILKAAMAKGIAADRIIIREAARSEVPAMLDCSHLAIFFIRPTYSKIASSPTKLGEIMSMGIPVICNSGIGDVVLNVGECGAVIHEFNDQEYDQVIANISALLAIPPDRIRQQAINFFSLDKGIQAYSDVYSVVLGK